jgi:hypothetical protein
MLLEVCFDSEGGFRTRRFFTSATEGGLILAFCSEPEGGLTMVFKIIGGSPSGFFELFVLFGF